MRQDMLEVEALTYHNDIYGAMIRGTRGVLGKHEPCWRVYDDLGVFDWNLVFVYPFIYLYRGVSGTAMEFRVKHESNNYNQNQLKTIPRPNSVANA